jgi:acetyl-CoA carboxylase biotin carboxyl carrier protein
MDLAELERLVALVQSAKIGELTLKQGQARITIRKASHSSQELSTSLVPYTQIYPDEREYSQAEEEFEAEEGEQSLLITAPLVGVFGHVRPLIGLGAKVKEGQVVGIIEAMKLVSEVKSPANGIVINVQVEDGLPVEYGQALFEILPEG